MTQTLRSNTIALIATSPVHCLDCFRLIRPGETYHQHTDHKVPSLG
jgi:hypothetical protein